MRSEDDALHVRCRDGDDVMGDDVIGFLREGVPTELVVDVEGSTMGPAVVIDMFE